MPRPSCKGAILAAAEAVVVEVGAGRLTIDAVADRSGVSKGGVLYHFPSKEALLEGMVERHIRRSEERRNTIMESLPDTPARLLLGEIEWLLGPRDPHDQLRSAAILAVIANQPSLMRSIREKQRQRFDELADMPGSFESNALILLAADGLFLMEVLQASPFSEDERQGLFQEIVRRARAVAGVESAVTSTTS